MENQNDILTSAWSPHETVFFLLAFHGTICVTWQLYSLSVTSSSFTVFSCYSSEPVIVQLLLIYWNKNLPLSWHCHVRGNFSPVTWKSENYWEVGLRALLTLHLDWRDLKWEQKHKMFWLKFSECFWILFSGLLDITFVCTGTCNPPDAQIFDCSVSVLVELPG